jgi:histidyl-tRNA synthetase
MKIDNSPARGMRDLLPEAVQKRTKALDVIVDTYAKFGYQRIETPAVESIERLTSGSSGSENQKLIYEILKRGLDPVVTAGTPLGELVELGLRFDLTVPLARFYANNQANLRMPFRALQAASVWRAERPQKGRYRQFMQCDIDMIGESSVLAEIELITATVEAITKLGIRSAQVNLSDRRVINAFADKFDIPQALRPGYLIALDKLDKLGWDGVRDEWRKIGISEASIKASNVLGSFSVSANAGEVIKEYLPDLPASIADDVQLTIDMCKKSGFPIGFWPSLVRGMGYYTGQVFEISSQDYRSGSLAGGGRYDDLLTPALGKQMPACGLSIGFERISELLGDQSAKTGLVVLFDSDVELSIVFSAAEKYRADGYDVSIVRQSGSMKAQIKRLTDWGFDSFVYLQSGKSHSPEVRKL